MKLIEMNVSSKHSSRQVSGIKDDKRKGSVQIIEQSNARGAFMYTLEL